MSTDSAVETHEFQAEVQQVLKLVIHSLYSNKDIFLRELVSNASDACDKLRFEALKDPSLAAAELGITIEVDAGARSLSVRDSGVGMDRGELAENLGTIARSGTRRFLEQLEAGQKADAQLIGQFGVGFYAAFIVADEVTVTSRRAGSDEAWAWSSSGDGRYSLAPAEFDMPHGTVVRLRLREGEDEYLDAWKLRSLVRTYSDHIGFPIRMAKPAPAGADGSGATQGQADGKADGKADEAGTDAAPGLEVVNQASALWTRPKTELSDEDYQGFYKHVSHDFGDALAWTHNRVEGNQNFVSLLYVPSRAPFDFQFNRDERKGLKLYIKRVFVMDAAEQMLPSYLRFVRGVVDSDDLPLNVSRELLQSNRQAERIRGALVKRTLDMLERIAADDDDRYTRFWKEFGAVLKEGVVEDATNRERVLKLLRFPSTRSGTAEELVSLDTYLARMAADQEAIYYLTADGFNAARNNPQLESLKARGVEVLLLHERIDEWMAGYLHEYQGKPLRNVAKGELDLGTDDEAAKARRDEAGKAAEGMLARIRAILGDQVREVRVSERLTQSPSCLVLEQFDMALHMQRLLKAAGQEVPDSKPVLEVNPGHPLLQQLEAEADEARATDLAWLLFEQAQLSAGGQLDDPAAFIARTNRLLGAEPAGG